MWFNKKEEEKVAPKEEGGDKESTSRKSLILEHEERISVLEMRLHELRALLLEKSQITGATRLNRMGRTLKGVSREVL